jgi:hypothetical protein
MSITRFLFSSVTLLFSVVDSVILVQKKSVILSYTVQIANFSVSKIPKGIHHIQQQHLLKLFRLQEFWVYYIKIICFKLPPYRKFI